jgi:hypothetical protein
MSLQKKKCGVSELPLLYSSRGIPERCLQAMIAQDFEPLQFINAGPPYDGERSQARCSDALCRANTLRVGSTRWLLLTWEVVDLVNALSSFIRWHRAAGGSFNSGTNRTQFLAPAEIDYTVFRQIVYVDMVGRDGKAI